MNTKNITPLTPEDTLLVSGGRRLNLFDLFLQEIQLPPRIPPCDPLGELSGPLRILERGPIRR